jgi:predicted transporter
MKIQNAAFISALFYLGAAIIAGAAFFIVTSISGFDMVARIGGAIWVFVLATIVLMPIVIPRVKRKYQR